LYGTGQAFFEQGSELNGFVVALSTSSLRKTFSVARCGAAQRSVCRNVRQKARLHNIPEQCTV